MKKKNDKTAKRNFPIAPFMVLFFFIVLGAIGISLGEPARVLQQATQICLSCIGID